MRATSTSRMDMNTARAQHLHPLQMHRVKETHKAAIEQDFVTGRKVINQYELLGEIGRGVHGKVKVARDLETGEKVAIKIIQRMSKRRRLGKADISPQDKTMREIAILKKIRHPNVVGLYEVIDDPQYEKIYMILEYVELGEVVWRKRGSPQICAFERRRIERELRGEDDDGEDERMFKLLERRRMRKDAQRAKLAQHPFRAADFWSLEHGDEDETPMALTESPPSLGGSRTTSRMPSLSSIEEVSPPGPSRSAGESSSRAPSRASEEVSPLAASATSRSSVEDEVGPLPKISSSHSSGAGLYANSQANYGRARSSSTTDSIMSHMSSVDDAIQHDSFEEDFSYVPCFTMDQARSTFKDTLLGLEYLHYEGIVHRDIKPANLLWTREHRVKISDFGVSYFGRPARESETPSPAEHVSDSDFDDDVELSKTVGTPAFFAPELCYTDLDTLPPKINDQIDIWSLGVTLYCLIFGRIPFLAEDEYQLFRAIAQQDVYIPSRRLKPVDSETEYPDESITEGAYRKDGELEMEPIDDELYDLLRRMLIKDPADRIKLREVKRHPWVLRGIDNIIGWLDDTDPSRCMAGQRIQIDECELERAVVPIGFVERARSAVKKAVGKVLGRSDAPQKGPSSSAHSRSARDESLSEDSTSKSLPIRTSDSASHDNKQHIPRHSPRHSIFHHARDPGHVQSPHAAHHFFRSSHSKHAMPSPFVGGLQYAASFLENHPPRLWEPSTPDSLRREREQIEAHRVSQEEIQQRRNLTVRGMELRAQAWKSCPPSPVRPSSSSENSCGRTPNTSVSNLTSPVTSETVDSPRHNQSKDPFASHPSLPALVSGSSSVSADQEGITGTESLKGSRDKAPAVLDLNKSEEQIMHEMYASQAQRELEEPPNHYSRDADESDSDEGLTMGQGKGKSGRKMSNSRARFQRRNTDISIESTGTAKKIVMDE